MQHATAKLSSLLGHPMGSLIRFLVYKQAERELNGLLLHPLCQKLNACKLCQPRAVLFGCAGYCDAN
jgi:hypothetical protein